MFTRRKKEEVTQKCSRCKEPLDKQRNKRNTWGWKCTSCRKELYKEKRELNKLKVWMESLTKNE